MLRTKTETSKVTKLDKAKRKSSRQYHPAVKISSHTGNKRHKLQQRISG